VAGWPIRRVAEGLRLSIGVGGPILGPMTSPTPAIHAAPNQVRRFIIENQPVRGYWVDLGSAWQDLRAHQQYSPAVQNLLGEAVSASVLLAATLKFEGTLTLQLEGRGDVRLLVAQCSNDFRVRAVARMRDDAQPDSDGDGSAADSAGSIVARASQLAAAFHTNGSGLPSGEAFRQLVGDEGRVIVTIEGTDKAMRYQGIVPLSGDSLAECLEAYFATSEQLPTRVRLGANDSRAVGLLVQKLPEKGGAELEAGSPSALAWQDAERGIAGVGPAELVGSSLQSVLEERFGERDLRVFKGSPVEFSCRCSQARVAGLLRSLGADEVRDVLREQGTVQVTCEFCQRPYSFDAFQVEQLFAPGATPDGTQSIH
jgi:molecular chaperone Hsp33